jgi:hypothetical protein
VRAAVAQWRYCCIVLGRLFIFIALCVAAPGADLNLEALRSTLLPMRGKQPGEATGPRGATPQLTVAKHQLLDWLDSRLGSLSREVDSLELQRNLNIELRDAGLSCEGSVKSPCPDWTLAGFAGRVAINWRAAFLVVTAGMGIECGYDESAYVFSWNGQKWVRVWQNEQNTYTKEGYKPQTLESVLISPYNRANDYLVLTLGSESWCSSNWHDVYYRAFRLGPDQEAHPLVSGSEWTAVGFREPPILGSISNDDVLIEYLRPSIDTGILTREAVFHYEIRHDQVRRTDPFALGPRDFVDEWLKTDWSETSTWSEAANRRAMLDWRGKLDKEGMTGEFVYPTMHCQAIPDLWQVGLSLTPGAESPNAKSTQAYFLVRWRPPYRFRMVSVTDKPSPDCTERDRGADDPKRSLFSVQEWR